MASKLSRAAAIVGAAEANQIGFLKEPKSSLQLHVEAIKNVSEQTGIPISRIDGIFSTGWSSELCEHLGMTPKYIDTTACGGCSFEMHVHHALAAIYSGIIDVALVSHGALIKSYLCYVEGRPLDRFWEPPTMHNCCHSIVEIAADGSAKIVQYADEPVG